MASPHIACFVPFNGACLAAKGRSSETFGTYQGWCPGLWDTSARHSRGSPGQCEERQVASGVFPKTPLDSGCTLHNRSRQAPSITRVGLLARAKNQGQRHLSAHAASCLPFAKNGAPLNSPVTRTSQSSPTRVKRKQVGEGGSIARLKTRIASTLHTRTATSTDLSALTSISPVRYLSAASLPALIAPMHRGMAVRAVSNCRTLPGAFAREYEMSEGLERQSYVTRTGEPPFQASRWMGACQPWGLSSTLTEASICVSTESLPLHIRYAGTSPHIYSPRADGNACC